MSDPFTGEVQIFGFNFAPIRWAACNGATIAIQQNTALFSLIGNRYGGNGTTTFQLPNLTNRAAMSQGAGPGRSPRLVGDTAGENTVSLTQNEMPAHPHALVAYNGGTGRVQAPASGAALGPTGRTSVYAPSTARADTTLHPSALLPTGGNQPHENRQPFLALNYCIALTGTYPSFG